MGMIERYGDSHHWLQGMQTPCGSGLIRSSSGHTSPGGGSVISEAEALRVAETIIIEAAQQGTVTARKDDAAAAVQAAIDNVAGSSSISGDGGGGLIHTTSG